MHIGRTIPLTILILCSVSTALLHAQTQIIRTHILQRNSATGAAITDGSDSQQDGLTKIDTTGVPKDIQVAALDTETVISWTAVGYGEGIVFRVYRHIVPIDAVTIEDAMLIASIDSQEGVNSVSDIPPQPGSFYYAVVPYFNGEENRYFAVDVNASGTAATIAYSPARAARFMVTNLQTSTHQEQVAIVFQPSIEPQDQYLLRAQFPIIDQATVRGATRITKLPFDKSSYIDTPPQQSVPYYYAVVPSSIIEDPSRTPRLIAGENATVFPVQTEYDYIPPAHPNQFTLRNNRNITDVPLPLINPNGFGSAIFETPEVIEPGTTRYVESAVVKEGLSPQVLPADTSIAGKSSAENPHEYQLFAILQRYFLTYKWAQSVDALSELKRAPITAALANRVEFYLAQSYYFSNRYQDALVSFATVTDELRQPSRAWIDATLALLNR